MRYVIVAILALLLGGGGLEFERSRVHYAYELGTAYGCGFIAARRLDWGPSKDPLDDEERPWCKAYRQSWESY